MVYSSYLTLNNGTEVPRLGLGVWKVNNGQEAIKSVKFAINTGYRLIDTAALYGNEESVGIAVKESKIPRDEIFITTKLWNTDQGFESTLEAFDVSLKKLNLDYVDLYLIHWPSHDMDLTLDTWKAFEELYKNKLVRAIGVSNFKPSHLDYLLKKIKVKPVINQIELHPYNAQLETRAYCKLHDIALESWSPLMQGGAVLEDPVIVELAEIYKKTPAQIVLRWHIQNNFVVIPKSVTPSRIKENFHVFDFEIEKADMENIDSLNKEKRVGPDPDGMGIRLYSSVSRGLNYIKKPKK